MTKQVYDRRDPRNDVSNELLRKGRSMTPGQHVIVTKPLKVRRVMPGSPATVFVDCGTSFDADELTVVEGEPIEIYCVSVDCDIWFCETIEEAQRLVRLKADRRISKLIAYVKGEIP